MASPALVVAEAVSHHYGRPPVRRQILFDVSLQIGTGEIVIMTGPSGSGKTTLLTLVGGLRAAQEGSLVVLDEQLRGAREETLVRVRKRIGYIFQAHNLLASLTAAQNVQMAVQLRQTRPRATVRERAHVALGEVGLGGLGNRYPDELSGGEKQRVAIARALVNEPGLILADEPTASLDRQTGRDVVEIIRRLAREKGCAVLLVTHDNRILDIADRIIHLEDGRLSSFAAAVAHNTRELMRMLAQNTRKGELTRLVGGLPVERFVALLERVTGEFQHLLQMTELGSDEALDSMLEQVIEAFALKVGQILDADRVSLFLVDEERGELWSKVASDADGLPLDIRLPISRGIAGRVATTGEAVNTSDAYGEPSFDPTVDERTGYRTRSLLCIPMRNSRGRVFAVAELLNKRARPAFDAADERRFRDLAASLGVLLESWGRMSRTRSASGASRS